MAGQGQRPHSNEFLLWRRDPSCSGAVGRAYRREQRDGRQRWIVIGEYCDGCHTFWPLADIEGRRRFYPPPRKRLATPVVNAPESPRTDEDDIPELIRYLRGEL